MNRRSFFRSIAKAAAIVALAPQIAFRAKPLELVPHSDLEQLFEKAYELRQYQRETIDILTDRATARKIEFMMKRYYDENMVPYSADELVKTDLTYIANQPGPRHYA